MKMRSKKLHSQKNKAAVAFICIISVGIDCMRESRWNISNSMLIHAPIKPSAVEFVLLRKYHLLCFFVSALLSFQFSVLKTWCESTHTLSKRWCHVEQWAWVWVMRSEHELRVWVEKRFVWVKLSRVCQKQ